MAKRLIDADALIEELRKSAEYHEERRLGYYSAIDHIREQPTVEVVFCKDCSWRDKDDDCVNPKCGKSWYGCHVPDKHYCSYGERKEGGQAPQREDV